MTPPAKPKAPERNLAEEIAVLRQSVDQLEQATRTGVAEHREVSGHAMTEMRQIVDDIHARMGRTQTLAEAVVQRYDRSLILKAWELFAACIQFNGYTKAWAGALTLLALLVWSTALAMKFVDIPTAVVQVQRLVEISNGGCYDAAPVLPIQPNSITP